MPYLPARGIVRPLDIPLLERVRHILRRGLTAIEDLTTRRDDISIGRK
jgi:hypothetical protein